VTIESHTPAQRRRDWLVQARLYLVCEARPGGRDPEAVLRPALQAGVDVVQLREKSGDERDIVRAGRVFRRLCDAYDALFIVNDRPELAIACAADGVHVGQDDPAPAEVRAMMGSASLRAATAAALLPEAIASSTLRTELLRRVRRALLTLVRRMVWRAMPDWRC